MVPMWSRAERFANVYAFVAVDATFACMASPDSTTSKNPAADMATVLWLSAFISVARWNAAGIIDGAEKEKKPRNCDVFIHGPAAKCKLSRVAVGFGAMILYAALSSTQVPLR
jgi:hypothetical protein